MGTGKGGWQLVCAALLWGPPPVTAALINGDFETGDLTGWTFTVHPDPLFGDASGGPAISMSCTNVAPLGYPSGDTWLPAGGNYFATLVLGAPRELLSGSLDVQPGYVLSFDYFFDYGDSQPGFPDAGYGRLVDTFGSTVHSFFEWNLKAEDMLVTGKEVPWTRVTHTFSTSGTFHLLLGVANPTDFDRSSILGVDNVTLTVPEPATAAGLLLLWGLGIDRRRFASR